MLSEFLAAAFPGLFHQHKALTCCPIQFRSQPLPVTHTISPFSAVFSLQSIFEVLIFHSCHHFSALLLSLTFFFMLKILFLGQKRSIPRALSEWLNGFHFMAQSFKEQIKKSFFWVLLRSDVDSWFSCSRTPFRLRNAHVPNYSALILDLNLSACKLILPKPSMVATVADKFLSDHFTALLCNSKPEQHDSLPDHRAEFLAFQWQMFPLKSPTAHLTAFEVDVSLRSDSTMRPLAPIDDCRSVFPSNRWR